MTEKDRMLSTLFSDKEGQTLGNIKFFLGDNRNVTEDELCEQVNHALEQERVGAITRAKSVDGNLKTISLREFLA